MLEDLKIDLEIDDSSMDSKLQRVLDKAIADISNITHQKKEYVVEKLREQVIELAVIKHNRKGSEGMSSQAYSGVSEVYENDIPPTMQRILIAHRKLKW